MTAEAFSFSPPSPTGGAGGRDGGGGEALESETHTQSWGKASDPSCHTINGPVVLVADGKCRPGNEQSGNQSNVFFTERDCETQL